MTHKEYGDGVDRLAVGRLNPIRPKVESLRTSGRLEGPVCDRIVRLLQAGSMSWADWNFINETVDRLGER